MWVTVDERFKTAEARLEAIEQEIYPLRGVDQRMKTTEERVEKAIVEVTAFDARIEDAANAVKELDRKSKDAYATKVKLTYEREEIDKEMKKTRDEATERLNELREYSAAEKDMLDMKAALEERIKG